MRRSFLLPEWLTVRQSAPALTKQHILEVQNMQSISRIWVIV